MGKKKNECRTLIGKSERKRLYGKYRLRSDENIKTDFNLIRM
jgi:hypothetical protein